MEFLLLTELMQLELRAVVEFIEVVGIEVEELLLPQLLVNGRKEPSEPSVFIDGTDCSLLRNIDSLRPVVRVGCCTLSKAVSTRSTFPTVFMLGLLAWSLSQQFEIKSLIAFEEMLVTSGRKLWRKTSSMNSGRPLYILKGFSSVHSSNSKTPKE
mmetsp:Transcript_17212/g.35354  ORF Transcript_17212/g.35354 Transcript_17212/m.35354 type:complete len:155 (-) Transcript_17212:264-728(-)